MNQPPKKPQRNLCVGCAYFYITWEKKFPYGCKAMKFKSKQYPSNVVFESSGMECQLFKPKEKKPTI